MFKKLVEFFTGKKSESKFAHPLDAVTTPTVPQAPYKVPEPVVVAPVVETPITVEKTVEAPTQPAVKKPAVKKLIVKKPAVKKPAVKKPAAATAHRKPRTPKQ